MRFCIHCGTKLDDGTRFCTNCGTPVQEEPSAAPTVPAQPAAPATQPAPAQPVAPAQPAPAPMQSPRPQQPAPIQSTTAQQAPAPLTQASPAAQPATPASAAVANGASTLLIGILIAAIAIVTGAIVLLIVNATVRIPNAATAYVSAVASGNYETARGLAGDDDINHVSLIQLNDALDSAQDDSQRISDVVALQRQLWPGGSMTFTYTVPSDSGDQIDASAAIRVQKESLIDSIIHAFNGQWRFSGLSSTFNVVLPTEESSVTVNGAKITVGDCSGVDADINVDNADSYKQCGFYVWPGQYSIEADGVSSGTVSVSPNKTETVVLQADSNVDEQSSSDTDKKDSTPAKPDITKLQSIISGYSSSDVAVSAMWLNDSASSKFSTAERVSDTNGAHGKFVSAGLYLPVYLAAKSSGGDALSQATAMMGSMDNGAGNAAIAALGGYDQLNSWLSNNGYKDTSFARDFGDVAASNNGYENYSSTDDAVRMLEAVDRAGGTGLMNVDIAGEGVSIPSGMTVHAHRGQGIQNTWNYFIIAETSHGKVAVAVATRNQGKEVAASLTSNVLAELNSELASKDK